MHVALLARERALLVVTRDHLADQPEREELHADDDEEHAEGEVVLIARRHLLKAWEDWRAGSAGTTFVHALRASRFVPQLVVSPVFPIAPDLLRFAAGAMAGKRGVHAIKVLRAWWRQILRRDPEAGRRARIHGSAPWADGDDSF